MRKRKELGECLKGLNLDAIVVSDPHNIRYLSGFSGGEGRLLVERGRKAKLLTDSRYSVWAKEEASGVGVEEVSDKYEVWLKSRFQQNAVKRVGFEGRHLHYAQYADWNRELDGVELVPLSDELVRLRRVKDGGELESIQNAARIGDETFEDVLGVLRTGMTERELANEIEYRLKANGAEGTSFDVIVASGANSAKPHANPTDKRIEKGDFVTMDFGCRYQGYCSDMTRTVVMGKASDRQRRIYDTVRGAQEEALLFLRAGLRGREVDQVAREYIDKAGFGACFGHGLGHGVGLEIHEEPRLSRKEEAWLLAGMVETVEPGIYIEGFGGVRIEDMVVVTKDGCENFTHSPKELLEC